MPPLELPVCTDARAQECHCMLFLTPDNEFAGDKQEIPLEEIKAVRETM